jgi:hypothetical protein
MWTGQSPSLQGIPLMWRDDLCVVPLIQGQDRIMGRDGADPSRLPPQLVELPLVRPILESRNKSGTHGISDNIIPLFIITFASP